MEAIGFIFILATIVIIAVWRNVKTSVPANEKHEEKENIISSEKNIRLNLYYPQTYRLSTDNKQRQLHNYDLPRRNIHN